MRGLCLSLPVLCLLAPYAACAEEAKDYTNVPLAEIGVRPVTPAKDVKTGFIVGGKNATALIRRLTEINGRSIAHLEEVMRPGAPHEVSSQAGFLGKDEKLLDILTMDNEFVVDKLGLTHQDVARPLHLSAVVGAKSRFDKTPSDRHGYPRATPFRYHGQHFEVTMICYKGMQPSPFYDNTDASCDAIVENLTVGKKLRYSLLVPHMIERYGFYEGRGTPYRVEPSEVLELFPFLRHPLPRSRDWSADAFMKADSPRPSSLGVTFQTIRDSRNPFFVAAEQ